MKNWFHVVMVVYRGFMFVNTSVNNVWLNSSGGSVALDPFCSSNSFFRNGCGSMRRYSFYSMLGVICVAHLYLNYQLSESGFLHFYPFLPILKSVFGVLFRDPIAILIRQLLVRGCLTPMVISPMMLPKPMMPCRSRVRNTSNGIARLCYVFAFSRYGISEVCNCCKVFNEILQLYSVLIFKVEIVYLAYLSIAC